MDVIEGLESISRGYLNHQDSPDANAASFIIMAAIEEIKRLRGNFKEKVVELMNAYTNATGEDPTVVHVPRIIETDILRLTYDDVGPLVNTINSEGSRNAFEKIFGMEVVWDADEFRVERLENGSTVTEEEGGDNEEE